MKIASRHFKYKMNRAGLQFWVQVIACFVVMIFGLVNYPRTDDAAAREFYVILISLSLGVLTPGPSLDKRKKFPMSH